VILACRVKVRLITKDRVVEGVALVNSGFEADSPDIVVPLSIAKELGLWPPKTSTIVSIETGGGEITLPYYTSCCKLELVLPDRHSKVIDVNIIVNPHIDEILISDYVASEFGITLLDLRRGLWRLSDDPPNIIRYSITK
jgi:hypothetical protein